MKHKMAGDEMETVNKMFRKIMKVKIKRGNHIYTDELAGRDMRLNGITKVVCPILVLDCYF